MDAVEEAKLKHGLKPDLPDFYNLILERPREDARGYGLLYVDVSSCPGMLSLLRQCLAGVGLDAVAEDSHKARGYFETKVWTRLSGSSVVVLFAALLLC